MKTKEIIVITLVCMFMLSAIGMVLSVGMYHKAVLVCANIFAVSFIAVLIAAFILPDVRAWNIQKE